MGRPRKQRPQTILAPLEISRDAFADSMHRLLKNLDFQKLRSQWLNIRYTILEEGKKKPSAEQWHVLDGFDRAVMEPEKWAAIALRNKASGEEADAPTSDLEA